MQNNSWIGLEDCFKKLKKIWRRPVSKEALGLFSNIQKSLKKLRREISPSSAGSKKRYFFNFLKLIHQVLKTHDLLFLSRQLSYHVVTTSDLPEAYGIQDEAVAVITELLLATSKQTGFGSRLEIRLKGVKLREGPAIQVRMIYQGQKVEEELRQKILEGIYGDTDKKGGKVKGVAFAKTLLRRMGGQLWLEFPHEEEVAYTFHWPAFDSLIGKSAVVYGTYKYDIWLTDYAKIRQRFGIARSKKMMSEIEKFVRSLVRHPVDMVVSFPSQGMVTAIYESQEGAASSVAARISQRLKKESFRLGKKSVNPKFRYQLSYLA